MFKNYFIVAIRNFWRNRLFSAINILGLAIGVSASLVIFLLISYHFTFDQFEKDGDRIYRVVSDFNFSGEAYYNSGVADPMPAAVQKEVTGLEAVVPFRTWNGSVKIGIDKAKGKDQTIYKKENNIVFADSNYFKLIGYEWVAGSVKTALSQPYQVVLTESKASQFFPKTSNANILGKTIHFNDTVHATVSGIVKDLSFNSDFTFTTFVSYTTLENTSLKPESWNEWGSTNGAQQLWVKLSKGTTVLQIEKQIARLYKSNNKREPGDNSTTTHILQPLPDLHFNQNYSGYDLPIAHKPTLYGLLAVAAFLLILGCINFINLTTAQASKRAKEIGIRKTMGSSGKQLIFQFLSETFLLTLTATLLSIFLTPLILQAFAGFIPKGVSFNIAAQPVILFFLIILILVVTLLSGFYPALILSSYKPVLVLKNLAYNNTGKTRNEWLRKSLTVSQFVIAQVFIMATILVSKQITYSLNKDQGFRKEAIVYFDTNFYDTVQGHKYVLMDKLRTIPEVAMASLCTSPPSSNNTWSGTIKYKDGKKEIEADVQQKYGDSNYLKLYGLHLVAGTNLAQTDTVNSFIINETYAHVLGFQQPQQAIGKYLDWSEKRIPICGVVKDFNQRSLHEPIKPLIIASWSNTERNISVALQPQTIAGGWKTAISKIEKAFKEVYPADDFESQFFDEDLAKYYEQEQNMEKLLMWATGLALFISCLGLLGLVIYTTNQRTKEIGVRKVLGASVAQIVSLLSKDFLQLIIVAFVIAVPITWYGSNQWLQNFAYKTDLSWWIFFAGGLIMLLMALFVLGIRTFKAAAANPVKSLRTE